MADFMSGKDGSLTYDGNKIARVASWSISNSVDALEVTSLADIARDYTPGLMSAQGSCTVWLYGDNANALLGKVVRTSAPTDADKLDMKLGFGEKSVTFKCIITQSDLVMSVGDVMQAQLSFQVCGPLSEVDLEG